MTRADEPRRLRQVLGWGVHFYTALGLACAAGIAVLLVRGTAEDFRRAFFLMLVATVIDATDGTLARRVRVKEVLPGFDGRKLDDLIDFLNYTFLPLFLVWRAEILPAGQEYWLLAPLFASAYGFCQADAKTADGYFLGFPSYWNLVAFYLYLLRPPDGVALGLLLTLAALTFVPLRYLYPTMRGRLNLVTNVLGATWAALVLGILYLLPESYPEARDWTLVSLYFPVFYLAASWVVSLRWWLRRRELSEEGEAS